MSEIKTLSDLRQDERNANKGTERGAEMLEESLRDYGAGRSVLADRDGRLIAGNKTVLGAARAGLDEVILVPTDGTKIVVVQRTDLSLDDAKARELALADNAVGEANLAWDTDVLMELEADGVGVRRFFSDEQLGALMDAAEQGKAAKSDADEEARQTLAERFGVPPFSVLDARQGYWQARKNAWLALGLRSFEGRGQNLAYDNAGAKPPSFYALRNEIRAASGVDPSWEQINAEAARRGMMSAAVEGTSIFDPVLCELCYRWFSPPRGAVLDPFAGGSVRGLIAAKLGRVYLGVDLRAEQCEANRAAWDEFEKSHEDSEMPNWICGDSRDVLAVTEVTHDVRKFFGADNCEGFDFVFSCPPYADLEQYSDDERDLSNMEYAEFVAAYREIIGASVARLKENRFACFVVGDVRDRHGNYRGFVADTIRAFEDAGARLYNDAVLVTQVSSAAVRAGRAFENSRKLCKVHQNVLVFIKGDAKAATAAVGTCEWGELSDDNALAGEDEGVED